MKTLKECLELAEMWGSSDEDAIIVYLSQAGKITGGYNILNQLLTKKISELEIFKNDAKALLSSPTPFYYKEYDFDTASKLDTLTRKMKLQMVLNSDDYDFMKTVKLPKSGCFWHDLAEAIKASQDEEYVPNFYQYKGVKDD